MDFDEAAAIAAIDACRRVAVAVDHAAEVRRHAAAAARVEWRGPARGDFDADVGSLHSEATHLVADLHATAAAIQRDLDEARWARAQRAG